MPGRASSPLIWRLLPPGVMELIQRRRNRSLLVVRGCSRRAAFIGDGRSVLGFRFDCAERGDFDDVVHDGRVFANSSFHTLKLKHAARPLNSCQNAEECGNESENNAQRSEAPGLNRSSSYRLPGNKCPNPGQDSDRMDEGEHAN